MPFKAPELLTSWRSYPVRIASLAFTWLIVITVLHLTLNTEREARPVIKMGYMPVVTNLAAPLLDAASLEFPSTLRFKAIKFASFAEMAEALRNREIEAAFIIAPLSVVLHQQGEDVRVVYIGNRHESTMVVRKDLTASSFADLSGKTVAVPMRYSGHHIAIRKLSTEAGIENQIHIVEMNPPDMASALAAGSLDAYFVGEPFAAQTLKHGTGKLLFYVESVWPGFICNLLLVKQSYIDAHPDRVQALVESAARSGIWAQGNVAQAARIASKYWGQPADLVEYALTTPDHRIVYDRFVPSETELRDLAEMMVTCGLTKNDTIGDLVVDRFARQVDLTEIQGFDSILTAP